jgi:NAD(P)H-nitrite reductase large subunit
MNKMILRQKAEKPFISYPDDSLIICRCEEITKGEIRQAIYQGMKTISEIKRYLRNGMGLCQGQTCNRLVRSIVAKELGVPMADVDHFTVRTPVRVASMVVYANDRYGEKGESKDEI